MKKFTHPLIAIPFFFACAGLTTFSAVRSSCRRSAFDVCRLVEKHYYKNADAEVRDWIQFCREQAGEQSFLSTRREVIRDINRVLKTLHTSHLFLFTPQENRAIWDHEAVDTGIRARMIDGSMVIDEVIEKSVADRVGVRVGDVIAAYEGEPIGSTDTVQSASGSYELDRGKETLKISIQAEPLAVDLGPRLTELDKTTARLRIQSFLARYFDREPWLAILKELPKYQHVIVDLRGNAGGSFPAMLRALSGFVCQPVRIGTIFQGAGRGRNPEAILADELATESQLKQLNEANQIHLETFSGYPCFDRKVTVLIDQDTSSVSEIFAEAFLSRKNSRVWGMATAGQVVMAEWFTVDGLGDGDYSISIPIAGYRTAKGFEIEDEGLFPEQPLYYDLERAKRGIDTWLDESRR